MFSSLRSNPSFSARSALGVALLFLASATLGCASEVASQEQASAASSGAAAASAGGADRVLAIVEGEPITLDDLGGQVGMELDQLEYQYLSQRHQLLEQGLEGILRERLLAAEAASQGVTVDELVGAEVGDIEVTDAQVVSFYEGNQARLQGRTLAELRPAIRQFLVEQQREGRIAELTEEIADRRAVERRLEPFRTDLETEGHPSFGPADAPLTLLEFSDFECPYCGGFYATLERIKETYGDQIRLVYRQFPLRQIHPNAQKAAEASLCAEEQGKFWEIHDLMFEEQHSLDAAALRDKASRLGMDMDWFNQCLDSGRYADQVQADLDAGSRVGVTGTPALFINGRPVEGGAVPYETVVEVIEDELERISR